MVGKTFQACGGVLEMGLGNSEMRGFPGGMSRWEVGGVNPHMALKVPVEVTSFEMKSNVLDFT